MLHRPVASACCIGLLHRPVALPRGPTLTLFGINFGGAYYTPTARIGLTQCSTTSWTSTTTLRCSSNGGTGVKLTLRVAVGSMATVSNVLSFDAPVLSEMRQPNLAQSGAGWLTLYGVNFGQSTLTATVKIGSTSCFSTTWVSTSSVSCYLRPGIGQQTNVVLSVGELTGTKQGLFSYNAPALTYIQRFNGVTSSDASITLTGFNLGNSDTSTSARLSSTLCCSTMFTSVTSLTCLNPAGTGGTHSLAVTVAMVVGTAASSPNLVYSYDAPVMSTFVPKNAGKRPSCQTYQN